MAWLLTILRCNKWESVSGVVVNNLRCNKWDSVSGVVAKYFKMQQMG